MQSPTDSVAMQGLPKQGEGCQKLSACHFSVGSIVGRVSV